MSQEQLAFFPINRYWNHIGTVESFRESRTIQSDDEVWK